MALFRTLFRRKQSTNSKEDNYNVIGGGGKRRGSTKSNNNNFAWNLNKDDLSENNSFHLPDVRLVIFRENEWKERRLLFDSDALQSSQVIKTSPVKTTTPSSVWDLSPQSPNGNASPVLEEETFITTRVKSDSKLLGEMIFGSITMNYKGDTIKLHQFKTPPKLMLSRVFNLPPLRRKSCQPTICENGPCNSSSSNNAVMTSSMTTTATTTTNNDSDSDSQYSTVNSLENYLNGGGGHKSSKSIPVDVPTTNNFVRQTTTPSPEGSDLTRSSSRDFNGGVGTPSTPLASSLRRYYINLATNLQGGVQRRSSHNLEEDADGNSGAFCVRKRIQLGMAVTFSLGDDEENLSPNAKYFRQFLFLHIQIIETELLYLQREILRACHSKRQFSAIVLQAWCQFRASLKHLFESSRLRTPVWLRLMNAGDESPTDRSDRKMETNFLSALFALSDICDRKETKFFISSLLTAFLTNHSSWISSVAPSTSASSLLLPKATTNGGRLPQWGRNTEAGCHPTNPFWAQLLEVWGSFNTRRHSLRTLVVGKDGDLLCQILFVLSYFLRCSSLTVKRTFDDVVECLPNLRCFFEENNEDDDGDDVVDNNKLENNGGNRSCSCSTLIKESTEICCTCDDDSTNRSKQIQFSLNDELDEENASKDKYQRIFTGAKIESIVTTTTLDDKNCYSAIKNNNYNNNNNDNDNNHSTTNVAQRKNFTNQKYCRNGLGYSLNASLVDQFNPHFALSAMMTSGDVNGQIQDGLRRVAFSDCTVASAACLVADTRDWSIRMISCESSSLSCSESPYLPSRSVLELVENIKTFRSSNCDTDFIFMFIEDWLTEIYAKGIALATLMDDNNDDSTSLDYLTALVGSDVSDLPLLLSVCSS